MYPVRIKDLKVGDYFLLSPIENPTSRQVYVRGSYDRSSKTYSCSRFNDICSERFLKGTKLVYVDFTF